MIQRYAIAFVLPLSIIGCASGSVRDCAELSAQFQSAPSSLGHAPLDASAILEHAVASAEKITDVGSRSRAFARIGRAMPGSAEGEKIAILKRVEEPNERSSVSDSIMHYFMRAGRIEEALAFRKQFHGTSSLASDYVDAARYLIEGGQEELARDYYQKANEAFQTPVQHSDAYTDFLLPHHDFEFFKLSVVGPGTRYFEEHRRRGFKSNGDRQAATIRAALLEHRAGHQSEVRRLVGELIREALQHNNGRSAAAQISNLVRWFDDLDAARSWLDEYQALVFNRDRFPRDIYSYFDLIRSFQSKGDDATVDLLVRWLERSFDPGFSDNAIPRFLAEWHVRRGDIETTERWLARVSEGLHGLIPAIAGAASEAGHYEYAFAKAATAPNELDRCSILNAIAKGYVKGGDSKQALATMKRIKDDGCIKLHSLSVIPRSVESNPYLDIARMATARGQPEIACEAVNRQPNWRIYYSREMVASYLALGRYEAGDLPGAIRMAEGSRSHEERVRAYVLISRLMRGEQFDGNDILRQY